MAHNISYNLSSHLEARTTTTPAQSMTSHEWFHARQAVSGIAGEHIVGAVLTAVLVIWGGWLMWALSHAIETYRVF